MASRSALVDAMVRSPDDPASKLIAAKLSIPRAADDVLPRPRLLELLDGGVRRPVTLVAAPPGAGKTVLLSSWIAAGATGMPVAWFSLDHTDDAAPRFWSYVLEAIRRSGGVPDDSVLTSLAVPPHGDLGSFVTAFANGVAELPKPVVLVLDDLQDVTDREVMRSLGLMARYGIPQLRLVVSTRRDPALPLGRLRVAGDLAEIRAVHLAFTMEETAALLASIHPSLSEEEIEVLWRRTEGWVSGLRLASLSLRERPNPHAFVAEFAGDDRTVADYLLAEVLSQQPESLRSFLLRTSVLDQVSGPLADALTGEEDGELTLLELERTNGFVVRVASGPAWYRYHQLLLELLRLELRHRMASEVPDLHRRAARWYAEHGSLTAALRHAALAEDWELAAGLLVEGWFTLFLEGETATLRRFLDLVPHEIVQDNPEVSLAVAGNRLALGDVEGADAYLRLAEANASLVPPEAVSRFAEASTIVTLYRARMTGDHERALLAAREAITAVSRRLNVGLLSDEDRRALALAHLGTTELWTGDFVSAAGHLEDGLALARRAGRDFVALDCMSGLAVLEATTGRLRRAEELAASAIDLAERRGWSTVPQVAAAHLGLAAVHYTRSDIEAAAAELDLAERAAAPEPALQVGIVLVRAGVIAAQGAAGAARALVRTTLLRMRDWRAPAFLEVLLRSAQAKLTADAGDPAAAQAFLDSLDPPSPMPVEVAVEHARLHLAGSDPAAAVECLGPTLDGSAPGTHPFLTMEAWVLDAVARARLGDRPVALRSLRHALDLAAPEGYRRVFVESGSGVKELLQEELRHGTGHRAFVGEILDAFERPQQGRVSARMLIEPLSDRERTILRFLPTMLTNREIAGEIYVSVNTVKTHVKNIYRKLEVRGRREAVARARRIRLI